MNESIIIIISSIATVAALFFLMPFVIKKAQDKNIPINNILDSSEQVLGIVQSVLSSLNIKSQTKDVLTAIANSATIAVQYAEQLYVSGQLPKEERKTAACDFVKKALQDADIEINEEREIIINSVIESAVYLLPKEQK